ncbi:type IV secretory system conjugative DNA transfer family protein [bacterium]|nr:type IV secretory system conjugative DNA transfer family protein [bacterium]MBO7044251.1 type IV secretory system conjugative DNA transfer family protein [bacterium]
MKIKEVIDYKDLFTHCSLIGATGSGKTSYILAIIKNIILENSNNNLVFIDGKNDLNLTKKLKDLAKQYNYDFYFFDNDNHHNNNFDYCYFENKTYMQIKEIILRLRTKELSNSSMGATYYFNQVNNYLFFIINLLMKNNIKIT